ncbi:MAG: DUF87 domain-containing protein [Candidatus Paceibacterota bacterium]
MEPGSFEEKRFSTPEEELIYLREKLRERNEGFEVSPEALDKEDESQREANRQVVSEYLEDDAHLETSFAETKDAVLQEVLGLEPEDHDAKIVELLTVAKEKGIKHTLSAIRSLNNPHLEDDFHRALVEYIKTNHGIAGVEANKRLFRALNLTLFEVTVSKSDLENIEKDAFKSTHFQMQELFAGLRSIAEAGSVTNHNDFYFTIEIALENVSSHVQFFLAIPKGKIELFEKQFSALFPSARLSFVKDDYNIFNESGVVSASVAHLKEHDIYPIRSFEAFNSDPLNTILNSFTQLNHEGEGAALQLLFSPRGENRLKHYRSVQEKVKEGKGIKSVLAEGSVTNELKKFFFAPKHKSDTEYAEKPASIDEKTINLIDEKISSPLYDVNVRILVSAPDIHRAQGIREGIEASFNQFSLEGSNGILFKEYKGSELLKLDRKFSFRMFDSKTALVLNQKEAATLVHIPGFGTHVLKSAGASGRESGAPPSDSPHEGLLLGVNTYRGKTKNIFVTPDDRLRHLYVIGQTGTGKSTLLKNMITQDILNGEGVCMIDPHGSDIEDILAIVPPERYEDVIYFDPSDQTRPMGLNMLEYDRTRPEQKTFVVNEMLSIFNKLFDMKTAGGPMFEQYFRNAVLLVLEGNEPATLFDVSRVLSDQSYRAKKLSESYNPVVVQFWNEIASKAGGEAALQNIVPYITSKFDVFLSNDIMRPIIAQRKSAFNFREVMDGKKILLVNLSKGRLGDINASLIGLIIVGKLLLAALSRVDGRGQDFPPFYLYLDEFQNITTDSIAVILSEARKYKLSMTVAHQFIAQLSDSIRNAVFGNVGSFATFRVGADDAEYLEKVFAPAFTSRDIMNTENRRAILKLLVHGTPRDPFVVETTPPLRGNEAQVEELKRLSREKFGRDRVEIEKSIIEEYRKK